VNATGYTCTCDAAGQFYGPQCQYNTLDLCTTQPCLHGGTCVNGNATSFVCQCPTGYGGATCSVSPCDSNPCPVNAPCVAIDAVQYTCQTHCNETAAYAVWFGGYYPAGGGFFLDQVDMQSRGLVGHQVNISGTGIGQFGAWLACPVVDNILIMTDTSSTYAIRVNLTSMTVTSAWPTVAGFSRIACSADNRRLYVAWATYIRVYNTTDGILIQSVVPFSLAGASITEFATRRSQPDVLWVNYGTASTAWLLALNTTTNYTVIYSIPSTRYGISYFSGSMSFNDDQNLMYVSYRILSPLVNGVMTLNITDNFSEAIPRWTKGSPRVLVDPTNSTLGYLWITSGTVPNFWKVDLTNMTILGTMQITFATVTQISFNPPGSQLILAEGLTSTSTNVYNYQTLQADGTAFVTGFTSQKIAFVSPLGTYAACRNGGQCTYDVCSCQPGFLGTSCEIDINECASQPCFNGATCVDAVNGFMCNCVLGFNGTVCQTNIDDCASQPCVNGGTCVDGIDSFLCQCSAGWNAVPKRHAVCQCRCHALQLQASLQCDAYGTANVGGREYRRTESVCRSARSCDAQRNRTVSEHDRVWLRRGRGVLFLEDVGCMSACQWYYRHVRHVAGQ
jgi:hypothetical protein